MISIAFGGVCSDKTIIHVHLNFKVVKKNIALIPLRVLNYQNLFSWSVKKFTHISIPRCVTVDIQDKA